MRPSKRTHFKFLLCLPLLCVLLTSCSLNGIGRNFLQVNKPRFALPDEYSPDGLTGETIKVVSYNILFSKKINKAIKLFQEHPDLVNADILCLQEMNLEAVHEISQTLKYNYIYYPAVVHPITNKVFGNAILSKWPIIDDRKIILPSQRQDKLQRVAVAASIEINKKNIMIYSVHFDIFTTPLNRRSHVNRIFLAMPSVINHSIVAGDFNTFTPLSRKTIIDQFVRSDFTFATRDLGWTHKQWYLLNKKSSVDHIFTRGFEVVKTGKIVDRSASDHLPIWAILRIE